MEILSGTGPAEAHPSITRYLLGLQIGAFQRLFAVLDDSSLPKVSWRNPFLQIRHPIPFAWNIEGDLSDVDRADPKRGLFIALSILTAGVSVRLIEGGSRLVMPSSIARYLPSFSPKEYRRCKEKWLQMRPDWIHYGDEFSGDGRNCTLTARGSKGKFGAGLDFAISPRMIDDRDQTSEFHVRVGLPCRKSRSLPAPGRWTDEERGTFRETVLGFLRALRDRVAQQSEDGFRELRLEVPPDKRSSGIDSFTASTESPDGVHYLSKVAIKPIAETVWAEFPRYTLGIEGPTLKLTDGQGNLLPFFSPTIMAVMLYPDDEDKRTEFLAQEHLRRLDEIVVSLEAEGHSSREIDEKFPPLVAWAVEEQGFFSPTLVRALRTGPSAAEIQATIKTLAADGLLAGELLLTMITCAKHHPHHVSVLKAIYLLRKSAARGMARVPASAPTGQTKLKEDWAQFEPVAHLWAAAHLGFLELQTAAAPRELVVHLDREFLAKAEELRRLGEECFARGQRVKGGPVLDPTRTWRPPRDLQLAEAALETEPLPDWSLELLDEYAA
jgi:hypothetical protein